MAKAKRQAVVPAAAGEQPECGPAMRALNPRWRRAVECLFLTEGDRTAALKLAGYTGKHESLKVMACRNYTDDRMRAAIPEEIMRRIDIAEPELFAIVSRIMNDANEKAADRLRAVSMIWDRSNPVMTKHKIEVEHHLTNDERDLQHWRALKKPTCLCATTSTRT
jgi:phage terminase small subunit